ncbi:hypothetical protein EV217_2880 [Phyllobacterium myrsinacearum]|uniref:hypothetical protein n=1 Tax=Phyllobacterium myrsinacearum TaxID=28101 RepID=UPI001029FA05|nr:hypothetical protein [Phyllobacterium myrsinacearum]RZS82067.1 hypothetical protein EV217_2880 [Phyllobacterium myrsinacearum]
MITERQRSNLAVVGELEEPIADLFDMQFILFMMWQDILRQSDKTGESIVKITLTDQETSAFDFAINNILRRLSLLKGQWNNIADGKAVSHA